MPLSIYSIFVNQYYEISAIMALKKFQTLKIFFK